MRTKSHFREHWKVAGNCEECEKLFSRKNKLKKEYDDRLRDLMIEAKDDWERAREVESYVNDYDEDVLTQRKMAECKYFYLFREAKIRKLGNE